MPKSQEEIRVDTVAQLDQLVDTLGARQIDISCDNGCSSDPCHERVLTIYGALGL